MPGAIISRICFYLRYPCRSEPARRPTFTMASRTASYAQGLSCGCQQRSRGKKRKRWSGMKLDRRTGLLASCLIWFEVQMSHYKFAKDLGACLNIKMPSYQYRDPHVKDKTTVLSLTWGFPYLERQSLYWNGPWWSWHMVPAICLFWK